MGAALSLGCGSGGRSLLVSAGNGDTATVREVLAVRPELAAYTYFGNGQNVAHVAAASGDREILQAIVEVLQSATKAPLSCDGGDLAFKEQTLNAVTMGRYLKEVMNGRSTAGQTPLMLACQNGHVSCAKFMLDHGADVFKVDKSQRRSAIHYAAASGQAGILRALLDENQLMHTEDGLQPLRHVRVHDMSGQCRYIDSRAENGVTALHLAAVYGEVACVHTLLAAGASMMVRTVDLDMISSVSIPAGSTPLHLAAQKGQVAIVQAMLQAHADALGNWAREDGQDNRGRRGWEQDGRIDLRSVANSLRQLPYHVAWQRGFREAAQVLNPTIPIDAALENVRELDEGFGSQKLQTLAAYALRKNLLVWLELHQVKLLEAGKEKELKEMRERVIADQRRKEALKFHSQKSAEASLAALDARLVSPRDAGHTFSIPGSTDAADAQTNEVMEVAANGRPISAAGQPQSARPAPPRSALKGGRRSMSLSGELPRLPPPPQPVASPPASRQQSISQEEISAAPVRAPVPPKKARGRLLPSRPAPPPPKAAMASEHAPAGTSATSSPASPATTRRNRHARKVSWEKINRRQSQDGEAATSSGGAGIPGSPSSWVQSPFASPFAQVSSTELPADGQEAGEEFAPQARVLNVSRHPSGIDLVDPPERSRALLDAEVPPIPSRSSSKVLAALPSFRSKKSLQAKKEPPGRADLQGAASIPGFDSNLDANEDCGICLDESVNVGINGCNHKLCCDCALKLCQVNKKPPLCPFCRTFIVGFHPAVEAKLWDL